MGPALILIHLLGTVPLAAPLTAACSSASHRTDPALHQMRLSGSIASEETVTIGVLRVMTEAAARTVEFDTQSARSFELQVDADRPAVVLMQVGRRRLSPFWLEPGADVRLEGTAGEVGPDLQITGGGSSGPALILTGRYEERWKAHLRAAQGRLDGDGEAASVESLLAANDAASREMDALVKGAGLSQTYQEVLLAENASRADRMRAWIVDALEEDSPERARIQALRVSSLKEHASAPGAAYGLRFIESYGDQLDRVYRSAVRSVGGAFAPSGFYHFRRSADATPELRDALALDLMASLLRAEDHSRELDELVEDFCRNATTSEARAFIEGMAESSRSIAPGQQAPELIAETIDGGSIDLADLRGKAVLLTVWGSWCPWSMEQLPHLEAFRRRMAESDPDIAFVMLGWDQPKSWRNAVEKAGLGGVHLLSDEDIRTRWSLTGTPGFLFIAPDGTIVTRDAPRPGSDEGKALATLLRGQRRR